MAEMVLDKVLEYEVTSAEVEKVEIHYIDRLPPIGAYGWVAMVGKFVVTEDGDFKPYFRQLAEGVASLTYYTDYFDGEGHNGENRNVNTATQLLENSNIGDILALYQDGEQYQQMVDWADELIDREKNVSYWDRAGKRAIELLNALKATLDNVNESGIIEKLNDAGVIDKLGMMMQTEEGISILKELGRKLISSKA